MPKRISKTKQKATTKKQLQIRKVSKKAKQTPKKKLSGKQNTAHVNKQQQQSKHFAQQKQQGIHKNLGKKKSVEGKQSNKGLKGQKIQKQQRKKLMPGTKQCRKCKTIMPIHRKVCTSCGNIHQMRRKKQDIMKNLNNKITPILIKSIIQNNQFNEFRGWSQQMKYQIGDCLITNNNRKDAQSQAEKRLANHNTAITGSRRKSSKSQTGKNAQKLESGQLPSSSTRFKKTENLSFEYLQVSNPVTSIACSNNYLVFCQCVYKKPLNISEIDKVTINTYSLHHYNLVGGPHSYMGESVLHYSQSQQNETSSLQFRFNKLHIKRYISKIKIFSNLVLMLTGESTLLIFSLPQKQPQVNNFCAQSSKEYILSDYLQIIEPLPNKITCFQFLRSTAKYNRQDGLSNNQEQHKAEDDHLQNQIMQRVNSKTQKKTKDSQKQKQRNSRKKKQSEEINKMENKRKQSNGNDDQRNRRVSQIKIIIGTLYGSISIYQINSKGYRIVRYIASAHWEMVTSLTQCSINTNQNRNMSQKQKQAQMQPQQIEQKQYSQQEQIQQQKVKSKHKGKNNKSAKSASKSNNLVNDNYEQKHSSQQNPILFASGCYDGTVCIWNLYETTPIFHYECSNKKIWSIYWDPGCKFLFINRDQLIDPLSKIQEKIWLGDCIETRNININFCGGYNNSTKSAVESSVKIKNKINKIMTAYSYYCQSIPVLDPINGIFKLLHLQQLRSNSLKKKKPKKDQQLQRHWKITFNFDHGNEGGNLQSLNRKGQLDIVNQMHDQEYNQNGEYSDQSEYQKLNKFDNSHQIQQENQDGTQKNKEQEDDAFQQINNKIYKDKNKYKAKTKSKSKPICKPEIPPRQQGKNHSQMHKYKTRSKSQPQAEAELGTSKPKTKIKNNKRIEAEDMDEELLNSKGKLRSLSRQSKQQMEIPILKTRSKSKSKSTPNQNVKVKRKQVLQEQVQRLDQRLSVKQNIRLLKLDKRAAQSRFQRYPVIIQQIIQGQISKDEERQNDQDSNLQMIQQQGIVRNRRNNAKNSKNSAKQKRRVKIGSSFNVDNDEQKQRKNMDQIQDKKFPVFSQLAIQKKQGMQFIYIASYNGLVLLYKNIIKSQ